MLASLGHESGVSGGPAARQRGQAVRVCGQCAVSALAEAEYDRSYDQIRMSAEAVGRTVCEERFLGETPCIAQRFLPGVCW